MLRKFPFLFLFLAVAIVGCSEAEEHAAVENEPEVHETVAKKDKDKKLDTIHNDRTKIDETKTVLAKVNGVPIYREDLRGRSLDKAIDEEILYQYGISLGYDKEVQQRVEDFKKSLVLSQVKIETIEDYMALNPVTREDIEEGFQQDRAQFIYLTLDELEIQDKETADKVLEEAKKGTSFRNIAEKHGESLVKLKEHDSASRRFNRFFNEFEVGSVSELIENNGMYYLYKITETQQLPRPDINRRVRLEKEAQRKGQAINNLVQRLKRSGEFEVERLR